MARVLLADLLFPKTVGCALGRIAILRPKAEFIGAIQWISIFLAYWLLPRARNRAILQASAGKRACGGGALVRCHRSEVPHDRVRFEEISTQAVAAPRGRKSGSNLLHGYGC